MWIVGLAVRLPQTPVAAEPDTTTCIYAPRNAGKTGFYFTGYAGIIKNHAGEGILVRAAGYCRKKSFGLLDHTKPGKSWHIKVA